MFKWRFGPPKLSTYLLTVLWTAIFWLLSRVTGVVTGVTIKYSDVITIKCFCQILEILYGTIDPVDKIAHGVVMYAS